MQQSEWITWRPTALIGDSDSPPHPPQIDSEPPPSPLISVIESAKGHMYTIHYARFTSDNFQKHAKSPLVWVIFENLVRIP